MANKLNGIITGRKEKKKSKIFRENSSSMKLQ